MSARSCFLVPEWSEENCCFRLPEENWEQPFARNRVPVGEIQSERHELNETGPEILSAMERMATRRIRKSDTERKPENILSEIKSETESDDSERKPENILSEIKSETESDDSERKPENILSEIKSETESDDSEIDEHWITDTEWLSYIEGDPHVRVTLSILRVPNFLKDTKMEAYVPQTISFGPYHHKSKEFAMMDHHKGRALHRMMIRSNNRKKLHPDNTEFAENATLNIVSVLDKIRDIYEESIEHYGVTLARKLCLDGCCILEVLRTLSGFPYDKDERNDPIFGKNKLAASNILKDIVMLENQIPSIVLLELLRLEYPEHELLTLEYPEHDQVETVLSDLLVKGTSDFFKIFGTRSMQWINQEVKEFDHVLGFLHKVIVYRPSIDEQDQDEHCFSIKSCIDHCLLMVQDELNDEWESIPTAVELNNAGIKFQPFNGGIKEIKFDPERAIIYLPVVSITYGTEVLFRNLIAFEMCRLSEICNYVISYVNLMDDLIDSQKDVALLRSMGILTKLVGSDKEVADLFNGLCKDVGTLRMAYLFAEVKMRVNVHYRSKIRVQFAELVRDYFSSSWKGLATAGAIAILIVSIVGLVFTIMSVYKKN